MENSHNPFYEHQQHPHGEHPVPAGPKQVDQIVPRSVEYVFLTIALLTAAASLIFVLIIWADSSLQKGSTSYDAMAFPASALIIALPVFAGLLANVERAELKNPSLKLDPYKRRSAQFIKVVAFTTCFFTLIGLVYGIFNRAANGSSGSLGGLFMDVFIILLVAGSILGYYLASDRRKY